MTAGSFFCGVFSSVNPKILRSRRGEPVEVHVGADERLTILHRASGRRAPDHAAGQLTAGRPAARRGPAPPAPAPQGRHEPPALVRPERSCESTWRWGVTSKPVNVSQPKPALTPCLLLRGHERRVSRRALLRPSTPSPQDLDSKLLGRIVCSTRLPPQLQSHLGVPPTVALQRPLALATQVRQFGAQGVA